MSDHMLRNRLIRLAHSNASIRPLLMPILREARHMDTRVAGDVTIPQVAIVAAFKKLEVLVQKYKRYEGSGGERPAGPDTTKFIAPYTGTLDAAKYGDQSHLVLGVKIGENFYANPFDIQDDYTKWRAENAKRERVIEQIKADVDSVLLPFMEEHGLSRVLRKPEYKDGSAYSTYGILHRTWMKVV